MAPTAATHFYKIMMGDFSDRLRIPPAFVNSISNGGSAREAGAVLVGPSGSVWKVMLSRLSRKDLYIVDGWGDFVKDHSLHEYDFLLFRYDGDMRFKVKIYDKTACEREDLFNVKRSFVHEDPPKRKKRARTENCSPVSSDLTLDNSNKINTPPDGKGECSAQAVQSCKSKTDVKLVQVNVVHIKDEVDCDEDYRDEVAVEKFNSFTSKNPFFSVRMKENNIRNRVVIVPLPFRDHLPKRTVWVDVLDPEGRLEKVRYICSGFSRVLSAGFSSIVRNNNINIGDMCVFELLDDLKLEVHIFRPYKQLALAVYNRQN